MQAGYRVAAIDGFADSQTRSMASLVEQVPFDAKGFNAEAMLAVVAKLDASLYSGFVYGSGFDAQPALLAEVAKCIPLLGNLPATLALVKSPSHFFSACAQLGIAYPQTWTDAHATLPSQGLIKSVGGSGGSHIKRYADTGLVINEQSYVQQALPGLPVSLLFLANGQHAARVGFNELLLAPTETMPYRYGGAVSQLDLPLAVQQQLLQAAEKLTAKFSLRGLNSLDALLHDGIAYVLEVNPRLSASVGLYEASNEEWHLLAMHVAASRPGQPLSLPVSLAVQIKSQGQAVLYSVLELNIPANFAWPDWAQDYPPRQSAVRVKAGEPICSVTASAANAEAAKQLLAIRVKMLNHLLANRLEEDEHASSD